ncbi:MAG TPA: DHA2 family efflux MFS transporter permease subunit [Magnetospirillaceae bacterium]|jgi:EmrB/QacA subfamily drug resistance transporter
MENVAKPWPALWALVVGFFMILMDTTIVSVANPKIMEGFKTDINSVIWVTSAYLLAYAVPLLITGRLGDRFGPKTLYLIGLVIFTAASVWCGLSGSIEMLVIARVVQGLGAACMTPQTMAVITRIFPPEGRGKAMGLWGAVAGLATLVGPVLGGAVVTTLGWEWIFFINLPIGIVAFALAWRLVPRLETHPHRFDILGVVLSAVGLFLVVFGIQEGETYHWGTIFGVVTVWSMIIAGLIVLVVFVVWQAKNKNEPLLPLSLFSHRNFSLANATITMIGIAISGVSLPLMFYFQIVLGFAPIGSAMMLVPMSVILLALAGFVGGLTDRVNPRNIAFAGLVFLAAGMVWYSLWLDTNVDHWWRLLFPAALLGVANACMWSPISSSATRNLPRHQAGAGSGVYNTMRQIGSVLGSAGISALMQTRLAADLPGGAGAGGTHFAGPLPEALHAGFANAMSEAMLLPAAAAAVGAVIVLFFAKPSTNHGWGK